MKPSDRILMNLYREAEAKDYELPDWDEDKLPSKEEIEAIMDANEEPEPSVEEMWVLDNERRARRDHARKRDAPHD